MKKITLSLLVFTLLWAPVFRAQTRIDQSKSDLKSGSSNTSSSSSNSSQSSSNTSRSNASSNVGDGIAEVFAEVALVLFYYSFIGDYKHEDHLYSPLTKYPFNNAGEGNFVASDSAVSAKNRFRLDVDSKFLYSDSNLYGSHLNLKIRPFQYFYLNTDYHYLTEKSAFTQAQSNLSIFQFNFNYDRIRLSKFNLGWSIGATYVASDVQKTGLSLGLNAEGFFGKRFSVYAQGKWSSVNGQPVNFLDIGTRAHHKKYYFSLGFERLKIGRPSYNFIGLGGGLYF